MPQTILVVSDRAVLVGQRLRHVTRQAVSPGVRIVVHKRMTELGFQQLLAFEVSMEVGVRRTHEPAVVSEPRFRAQGTIACRNRLAGDKQFLAVVGGSIGIDRFAELQLIGRIPDQPLVQVHAFDLVFGSGRRRSRQYLVDQGGFDKPDAARQAQVPPVARLPGGKTGKLADFGVVAGSDQIAFRFRARCQVVQRQIGHAIPGMIEGQRLTADVFPGHTVIDRIEIDVGVQRIPAEAVAAREQKVFLVENSAFTAVLVIVFVLGAIPVAAVRRSILLGEPVLDRIDAAGQVVVVELVARLAVKGAEWKTAGRKQVEEQIAGDELILCIQPFLGIGLVRRQAEAAVQQREPGTPEIGAGTDRAGVAQVGTAPGVITARVADAIGAADLAPEAQWICVPVLLRHRVTRPHNQRQGQQVAKNE